MVTRLSTEINREPLLKREDNFDIEDPVSTSLTELGINLEELASNSPFRSVIETEFNRKRNCLRWAFVDSILERTLQSLFLNTAAIHPNVKEQKRLCTSRIFLPGPLFTRSRSRNTKNRESIQKLIARRGANGFYSHTRGFSTDCSGTTYINYSPQGVVILAL